MNQHVVFASPDMTLEQLAELFALKRVNPIPVTDNQNRLLGIVSRSDLIKFFSGSKLETDYVPEERAHRTIDDEVAYVASDFRSRFAYVAKARANIWLTAAIVLFIAGFIIGIVYVADPNVFTSDPPQQSIPY
jgi:CBS-domain-containing membrane protein